MQVVLTDQEHILPLTRENLAINFPATTMNSSSRPEHAGAGGCFGQLARQNQAAAAEQLRPDAAGGTVLARCEGGAVQQQQPMSAAAAFSAAFGSQQTPTSGDVPIQASSQQQPCTDSTNMYLSSRVFGPGPLVVEHNWGEPLQQLQDRMAAAAAARLGSCGTKGSVGANSNGQATQQQQHEEVSQQLDSTARKNMATAAATAEQQQAAVPGPIVPGDQLGPGSSCSRHTSAPKCTQHNSQQLACQAFDVIVGADLLYDMTHHAALLQSLQQLAAASPHLQVFLCWRDRSLGEGAFLDAAAAAGWVIQEVPVTMLHPEFQTGYYKLVCMVRLP